MTSRHSSPSGKSEWRTEALIGRLNDVGTILRALASFSVLTENVVKTSEIEGERLDVGVVRLSIARRLGVVDIGALAPAGRHVEGLSI
jgi:hypothetical protein